MPFDLFDESPVVQQGKVIPPQFAYVKAGLLREIQKVYSYYHSRVTFVNNSHVLVRLIKSLPISMRRDPQNYVDVVNDLAPQVCNSLHITNSLGYGRAFTPGVFYGKSVTEILIMDETPFDPYQALANWRMLKPIRVLRHPFTDMSMPRAMGDYHGTERGIAVIAINVAMLAIQYRGWYREERQPDPSMPARRTHQFMSMYPITNMVGSHLDIAIFNRLVGHYLGEEVQPYHKSHPIYLIDHTEKMDDVLLKELTILRRRPLTFDQILDAVPAIASSDLRVVMRMPSVVPTRQVKWALTVARLPLIRFLVQLNYDTENPKNRYYLNRLKQQLHAMRVDRTLDQILPLDVTQDIDNMIHRDIQAFI